MVCRYEVVFSDSVSTPSTMRAFADGQLVQEVEFTATVLRSEVRAKDKAGKNCVVLSVEGVVRHVETGNAESKKSDFVPKENPNGR